MSVVRIGEGDLKLVKQTLVKYTRGEVSHIANVMKTEKREREHRRLNRKEETLVEEEETTETKERDLQTTDRFEMQREVQSTIKDDDKFDTNLKVSGSYGTVKVVSTSNFATASSSTQASKAASTYAKSVTERAAAKVTDRTKEVRTRTTLSEIEDTNTHVFDNSKSPTGHVSGIYQWVDKLYSAQVMNYGTRVMVELVVPEPAAMWLHAREHTTPKGLMVKKPPPLGALKPDDVTPTNYLALVAKYKVKKVDPPPPKVKLIATTIELGDQTGPKVVSKTNKELKVPDGYQAVFAWAVGAGARWSVWDDDPYAPHVEPIIGRFNMGKGGVTYATWGKIEDHMGAPDSVVPVSVFSDGVSGFVYNVEVRCARTREKLEDWQLATYDAIVTSHATQQAAYDAAVKASKFEEDTSTTSVRASAASRAIEQAELQRACITLLAGEDYSQFDAMKLPAGSGYPEIDRAEAATEGPLIQFLEQAFEWDKMTYSFYPYFWARKNKWIDLLDEADADAGFTDFLRAGSARVVVPVREGYDAPFAYFQQTGQPWLGGTPPVISDPLYVSILANVKAKTKKWEGSVPDGDPWQYKVPTTLVILPGEALPDFTTTGSTQGGG